MTDGEALVAAIADNPREHTPRLAYGDWLAEHGQPTRAAFVRLQCQAGQLKPGSVPRADAFRAAEDLRAEHEADWLGKWAKRLVVWEYRRGFLWRVRMTAKDFLAHGEELFRHEPIQKLELVQKPKGRAFDRGDVLDADIVREVVGSPAFGYVRKCAVVTSFFKQDMDVWLQALSTAKHVNKLRSFGPCAQSHLYNAIGDRFGIGEKALTAFCLAPHLHTLRSLNLRSCALRDVTDKNALVTHIAQSPFARNLRHLKLSQCRLGEDGFARLANDPVFARLKSLDVSYNASDEPDAWEELFRTRTLTSLRSFRLGANHLTAYAVSPLAHQIRSLSVYGVDDDTQITRSAWPGLIDSAPPPRKLALECYNPGKAAFAEMRKKRWLRRVRSLTITSDSQSEVYGGQMTGVRSLFGPRAMPRLTKLNLHEAGTREVLATLGAWPGVSHLESLDLADDYHGRFKPANFPAKHSLACLRTLRGVILSSDEDVDHFLALPDLDNLTSLQLSFLGHYDSTTYRYTDRVVLTEAAAERVIRSERLARLTDLTLGFAYTRRLEFYISPQFADQTVMPRLQKLRLYVTRDGRGDDRPAIDGVKARFGLRLIAW
jgi:uncharacterized protein (TIGR02996 family)